MSTKFIKILLHVCVLIHAIVQLNTVIVIKTLFNQLQSVSMQHKLVLPLADLDLTFFYHAAYSYIILSTYAYYYML